MIGKKVRVLISKLGYEKEITGKIIDKFKGNSDYDFYLIQADDKLHKICIWDISKIEILN